MLPKDHLTRILIYGSNVYNGCYPKTSSYSAMFIMDVTQCRILIMAAMFIMDDHLTRILIYGSNVYNGCYPKTILLVFLYTAMFIMDLTRILIYGSNVYNGCYPKDSSILLVFLYMVAMFIMDVTQRPSYSYSYIWQQCL